MLRIIPQNNSAAAKSYYSQTDYYLAGDAPYARWGGHGAALLGLSGSVRQADFDNLCDNRDPRSGQPLTPRTRTDRTVLYDFNVSVPKSLSVLIEESGDPKLLEAVQRASEAMMNEAEAEMQTRVRKNNQDSNRQTGNMVYATILHHTSRPCKEDGLPDPQTHLHITVFNATFDSVEQQWKAGQFRDLVRDAPYWQAVFHAKLASEVSQLGYGIQRNTKGWDVSGVPQTVLDKFSRRTAEIERLAQQLNITDPVAKSKLGATSRENKSTESLESLQYYWHNRLTPEEQASLKEVIDEASSGETVRAISSIQDVVAHAIEHQFATASVVCEKRLVAEALTYGVGSVSPEAVRAEMNRQGVMTRNWEGRLVATTPEVLREEERMLEFARSGRGSHKPLAARHVIQDERLNADQRGAIQQILNSPDRVMLIRGAAGVGKTTLMQEAVRAIEATGKPVVTLAPSADASRGTLRQEGFDSADTVATFLTNQDFREQARDGVIWVDEAGLLGAPTMAKLFEKAHELKARVILMGDTKQHAAVERGAALRLLERNAGLPVAQVRTILRQQGLYKSAVERLADGLTSEGFQQLDELGWVHELPDGEREQALARSYADAQERGEKVLVVSPTHAEGQLVVEAIRKELKSREKLGEERNFLQLRPTNWTEAQRKDAVHYQPGDVIQFTRAAPGHRAGSRVVVGSTNQDLPLSQADRFQAYHAAQLSIAAGELIRITANGWTKDREHRLNNGSTYTVAGFTKTGDLRLNNGWVIAKDFGHLASGYVGTSHGSQGRTVDRVLIAQSTLSHPASSQEQFYVSVSRGRQSVTIFTDKKEVLQDAVKRRDLRLSATELFSGLNPAKLQSAGEGQRGKPSGYPLRNWVAHWQRRQAMQRSRMQQDTQNSNQAQCGAGR